MLRVGLTGGIGTGKSYVRARFELRGLPAIDADALARDVVAPGTPALDAVRARFGDAVFGADGALDRRALGAVVFGDDSARHDLERIIHPAVYEAIQHWFEEQRAGGATVAIADIPLLFETGERYHMDAIVVVACTPDEQLRRVARRGGMSEASARARIAAQWPIEQKVERADYVIRTDGAFAETDRLVDEVVIALKARAGGQG
jgi:dephospho-CoA kinase